ncbi:hypothetical protein CEXT_405871 [Caerostris extrusa]|uniref:Endonuclease/exonuclease/phosphatase domain-containing protein n=1 Tax=Caerostris extrusa TaxID=172846 RepID=A0AAV4UNQ4_CAEEX|nr:hypothetical protein CEXT_405871 [Caerostris extrusa]
MDQLHLNDRNTASSVALDKQGRERDLGRGVKLDKILELASKHQVSIIALQETKLNTRHRLRVKGYNIVRQDRYSNGGGGLMFLIRDNNQKLDLDALEGLFTNATVLLGDLNAKHTAWGCALANNRGKDLENLSNDKAFLFLNNGTHTYRSHSYNTIDALDLTISSPDLFPYCSWKVVDYVGSDHYPILIELDYDVKIYGNNNIY